jgi:uncharacterized repeat protein (TIGR01451 family)
MTKNRAYAKYFLNLLLICLFLLANPAAVALAQGPSVTPDSLSATLSVNECLPGAVTAQTTEAPPARLDVLFIIDETGSMLGVINQVRENIVPIADTIRNVTPDTVFALATVADYPGPDRDEGIEPWNLEQTFTTDVDLLDAGLSRLNLLISGDNEEAYLRGLYEAQFLDWRPDTRRLVILFGDAPAHDPDVGPDGQPGTADDLTQSAIVTQLTATNIAVLTISADAADFFRTISEATGGQYFPLSAVEQVPEAIQTLLEQTISQINTLNFSDTAPGPGWLTWEPPAHQAVAPGEARDFTLTLCVPEGTPAGDYAFTITAQADGVPLGQIAASVTVLPRPNLVLTQSVQPESVSSGESFTYRLTVTNQGADPATDATLTVDLSPAIVVSAIEASQGNCTQQDSGVACNLGTLGPGEQGEVTITAVMAEEGVLSATAAVNSAEDDLEVEDNSATLSVSAPAPAMADLSLSQTGPGGAQPLGQPLTYQINVHNAGPSEATGVVLSNRLPENVELVGMAADQGECRQEGGSVICQVGELAPGQSAGVNLMFRPVGDGPIMNSASVSADQPDPNQDNSAISDTGTTVIPAADLDFTVNNPEGVITPGDRFDFTVDLVNNGPSDATGLKLTGRLPQNAEFDSASIDGGTCSEAGGLVTCELERLPGGERATASIALRPTTAGELATVVELTGNELDPAPSDGGFVNNISITPASAVEPSEAGGAAAIAMDIISSVPWWVYLILVLPFLGLLLIDIYEGIVDPARRNE